MPNMSQNQAQLSDKDLLYIKDELGAELLMIKRYHDAGQNVTDQDIRQAFEQACDMHQRHYRTLLSHLQGTGSAQIQ